MERYPPLPSRATSKLRNCRDLCGLVRNCGCLFLSFLCCDKDRNAMLRSAPVPNVDIAAKISAFPL